MILHGQGEGPVRICNPCKKLEDAARFESRYGQRKRASKGTSKPTPQMQAGLLLEEIIPIEPSAQISGKNDFVTDSHNLHTLQDGECVNMSDQKSHSTGKLMETETELNGRNENTLVSPEILRQQAQEEKRQWIALKREGKGEEALQAFKRGKELERQAESLKLSLRRTQRRATNPPVCRKEKHEDNSGSYRRKKTRNLAAGEGVGIDINIEPIMSEQRLEESVEKNDLMSALKELGWSNADLHEAGRKEAKARSVEGELAEIAAAVHEVEGSNSQGGVSSMQVLALKRRALALKREGKLAEAKEELKKAKTIERQLEEQEIAYGQESDDDLAALIQGLEKESATQTIGSATLGMASHNSMINLDYEDDDEGIEVSDSDMNDPEMVAALRSMGWEEEAAAMENCPVSFSGKDTAYVVSGASSTSKQPLNRSFGSVGNNKSQEPSEESKDILRSVEESLNDNLENVHVTEEDMEDPYFLSAIKAMGFPEDDPAQMMQPVMALIPKPFEKKNLEQEILFLKKEALALKRAGNIEKAKEELQQAKRLEKELEEMQSLHMEEGDVLAAFAGQKANDKKGALVTSHGKADFIGEEPECDDVDVTEEDMGDPELAKELKSLGWQDDYTTQDNVQTAEEGLNSSGKFSRVACGFHVPNTKSELQKELLGLKRAALKLKRGGRLEEAEDELEKARVIEQLMQESENVPVAPKKGPDTHNDKVYDLAYSENDIDEVKEHDMEDPTMLAALKRFGWNEAEKDVKMVPGTVLDHTSAFSLSLSTILQKSSCDIHSQREGTGIASLDSDLGGVLHIQTPVIESEKQNLCVVHPVNSGDLLTGEAWGAEDREGIDGNVLDTSVKISERREVEGSTSFSHRSSMEFQHAKVENPGSNVKLGDSVPLSEAPVKTGDQMIGTPVEKNDNVELDIFTMETPSSVETLQHEILAYKKKALALKHEGRNAEAKEQLRHAKLLEKELAVQKSGIATTQTELERASSGALATPNVAQPQEADGSRPGAGSHDSLASVASAGALPTPAQKYTAGKDRLKLQRESLAHKRKALALRREGRMEEAEAEFELAKSMEKQMEELGGSDPGNGAVPKTGGAGPIFGHQDEEGVDDIFDPQLVAALKGLGWKEIDYLGAAPKAGQKVKEKVPTGNSGKADMATGTNFKQNEEKHQLEAKIKSEKVRAVQLKRSGRQSEALDALRAAKQLERQLQSMYQ